MIDIKFIKQNLETIKKSLKSRNLDFPLDHLLEIDTNLKEKQQQSQALSATRNKLAKDIGQAKANKQDATALLEEVSKTKEMEDTLVNETKELEEKLKNLLSFMPNIPSEDVPYGVDESGNKEVKKFGTPKTFSFKPKEHFELGKDLGMMDFEVAAKLSGSRFVVLREDLSLLERALYNFMLDLHTKKHGYKEHSVPVLMREEMLFNTAQLPKFAEDLFKTTDDKWLISTTEIPLTNLVANEFLEEESLPIRNTGLSLCFRSEAGATGKDTKGMLRQHQFYKVELVSITAPEKSEEELEYMLSCAEEVLKQLELPYRVMLLCTGDMGFTSSKTYDIEVWLPGQNTYREISSCSNCKDFQSRRMNAKIKSKHKDEKHRLVHTLNGSGLAVGRTLIAVLENYQQEDGSIIVPKVLQPYMNGKAVIKK
jgi:seryl-tRNA synthetase